MASGWLFALLASLLLVGCNGQTPAEKAYVEERQAARAERERLAAELKGETGPSEAIDLVQRSTSTQTGDTVREWIGSVLADEEGDVLFPRWQASEHSLNRYRVTFSYSLMDEEFEIVRRGFQWEADLVVEVVSGPEPFDPPLAAGMTRPVQTPASTADGPPPLEGLSLE